MPYNKEKKRAYYEKNKEKILEIRKAYYEKNREEKKRQSKEWYEKNKERVKVQSKEWYEKNKDKILEQGKEYRKNNPGTMMKSDWRRRGLIHDNYDELYERYCNSTNCEECGCEYGVRGDGSGKFRCMDHDHETGLFRNFLCSKCNIKRR